MYLDVRKRKDGTVVYRFTYLEDGRRRRFPQAKVPRFDSREEAEEWGRSQAAIMETKRAHIARKLSWRSRHYQFEELLEKYAGWQKERAPNSWDSCVYYLEHWVFPYFLNELKSGNVNDWHLLFQGFRDWLKSPAAMQRKGRDEPLAVSTMNNIIKALNTFLECLRSYNLIDPASAQKCEAYGEHLVAHRDASAIILEGERDIVVAKLRNVYAPAADFFEVLWHTGMRFGELFGLPITGLFRGEVEAGPLRDELKKCDIDYVGYLYLDSQPFHDDRRREEDGSIKRKPLKSCKEISPKYARVIPIQSKDVWNILAVRYKAQLESFAKKSHGANRADYVFFDDCEWNKTVGALREAYRLMDAEPKSYHCCRHTFTTLLVGQTRSYFLARMITGHKSQKAFERYLHIHEQIAMQAKQKEQLIDVI